MSVGFNLIGKLCYKSLLKRTFIAMSLTVILLLLPNSVIKAQQISEVRRQTLVAQLTQQIVQLQKQLTQLLTQQQANPGIPIRLTIPKINVDAVIDHVGVTSKGAIGVPKGPNDVAWFDLGPRPGNIGSAIIDGHYGPWKNGGGSVFDDLNKLKIGDKLYVEDEKGNTLTFVVRESRNYNLTVDASEIFASNDGKSHLNLITCEGIWDENSKTYSMRLVVFADKEIKQ